MAKKKSSIVLHPLEAAALKRLETNNDPLEVIVAMVQAGGEVAEDAVIAYYPGPMAESQPAIDRLVKTGKLLRRKDDTLLVGSTR